MLKIKYLFILTSILLTACIQTPSDVPTLPLPARQKILQQMHHWQANGRVGIQNQQVNESVSFEWQQLNEKYDLYLFSPLATESARIIAKPGHASLTTSGKTYVGTKAEELVFEHLGWDLPFNNVIFWIKGMPAPYSNITRIKYDKYNQLYLLEQDGWSIEYQTYMVTDRITLPEKMTITDGTNKVKLVIRDWQN